MSRAWLKLHTSLATHPKWLQLSGEGRGAWVSLLVMSPDGFSSIEHARLLLARDSIDPATVDELVRLHLIDEESDGRLSFHDFADHQVIYRGPSDDPDAKAVRNRRNHESRKRRQASDGQRRSATVSDRGDSEEKRGDSDKESPQTGTTLREVDDDVQAPSQQPRPHVTAFRTRGYQLSSAQEAVLDTIVRADGGANRLVRIIDAAPREGDLFRLVIDARNRERDEARADGRRADEEQQRRAGLAQARAPQLPDWAEGWP